MVDYIIPMSIATWMLLGIHLFGDKLRLNHDFTNILLFTSWLTLVVVTAISIIEFILDVIANLPLFK